MSETPLPAPELADQLAEIYLLVGPLYRRVLRAVERDEPDNQVTVGVRAVLDQLRRNGPMTVPQIGRSQSLSRQFVQRMVNDARADDLVELADNPDHQRSKLVALTDVGRSTIDAVVRGEHEQLSHVGRHLTAADLTATRRVLTAMLAALDDIEP
ncbi:MarR family winged helix-turn-helix transcriptional regulator [Pseudonocardia spinosispora]|uniref:MarR family winged helix-turn-helix transcriptional regulator n=1 Tax=Pseudonocardia spinosispora TaxID=103441 RepID=UPI000402BC39|nr:MarR family transcriptional regulator [Pseudonocardia spinosispora]